MIFQLDTNKLFIDNCSTYNNKQKKYVKKLLVCLNSCFKKIEIEHIVKKYNP